MSIITFIKNDLKDFLFYLATEPFVQLWGYFRLMAYRSRVFNKLRVWVKIYMALTFLSLIAGNKWAVTVFGIVTILTIVKYEWDKGYWREKRRKRNIERMSGK